MTITDDLINKRAELMFSIEDLLRQNSKTLDYGERAAVIAGLTELRRRLADLQNEIANTQLKSARLVKPSKKPKT